MKTLFLILMLLIPLRGVADIYKCRDTRAAVAYQDTPCVTGMVALLKPAPSPSDKDVAQARQNLERMMEGNRRYEQRRREEWAKKQEELRFVEAQEIREPTAADAYADDSRPYVPVYGYGRWPHSHSRGHHRLARETATPRGPCVIGYIGDKGCR